MDPRRRGSSRERIHASPDQELLEESRIQTARNLGKHTEDDNATRGYAARMVCSSKALVQATHAGGILEKTGKLPYLWPRNLFQAFPCLGVQEKRRDTDSIADNLSSLWIPDDLPGARFLVSMRWSRTVLGWSPDQYDTRPKADHLSPA